MDEQARRKLERKAEENLQRLGEQIEHVKSLAVRARDGTRITYYEAVQDLVVRELAVRSKFEELKRADATAWESDYSAYDDAYNLLSEDLARARFLMS
ncbi:MAG: hypothetical protein HY735_08290 [Verrucomicrobia bacterium]|nr:hypothetical protein [Verrucomicrobiota bacterium]